MSNDNLTRFTTYGPNRGLTLAIGAYQFIDGVCALPAQDAHAAASILCRYHDVCHAHELEEKIAEYDAAFPQLPENPPAPPVPDTSGITLPPEGSEIVLVPTPLSQLVQPPPAEAEKPAADDANNGEPDTGKTLEGKPAANEAGQGEPDTKNTAAAAPEGKEAEAKAKEAEAREAPAKSQTPKKPNSK